MTTTPYNLLFTGGQPTTPDPSRPPVPITAQNYQNMTPGVYNQVDANSLSQQAANPTGPTYQNAPDQNELVSGQLNGLLASDSPYIQLARAQGEQSAASRGLLNSSMAAGTAENAAIQSALPIAQGNAQEYSQVSAMNQQAANQFTGENIAAHAQLGSAGMYASAMMHNADIQARVQREGQAQQFQEYGMGLGYQYAGLNQSGQEFQQQLKQQMAQFTDTQNIGIGEFQQQMDWQKYATGLQMQENTQGMYANMFGAIMQNPNMTADDRQAALGNAQSFFGQMSQQDASIPAFMPNFTVDPNYWSTNWTAGG